MKLRKTAQGYLASFEPGEEIISGLADVTIREEIQSATFTAIGAVSFVELGYYELSEKQYHWKKFEGTIEVVSAMGNIAWLLDTPIVHMHGVFSGTDFQAFAGHVRKAVVSAACEVVIVVYQEKLLREYNKDVGLNLWKL